MSSETHFCNIKESFQSRHVWLTEVWLSTHSHVSAFDFEGNNLTINIKSIQTDMNLIQIHLNPQSQLLWFHSASVASLERRASLMESSSSPPLSSSFPPMVSNASTRYFSDGQDHLLSMAGYISTFCISENNSLLNEDTRQGRSDRRQTPY